MTGFYVGCITLFESLPVRTGSLPRSRRPHRVRGRFALHASRTEALRSIALASLAPQENVIVNQDEHERLVSAFLEDGLISRKCFIWKYAKYIGRCEGRSQPGGHR
jgi:hypothetical protein